MAEDLMTAAEIADRLGIGLNTVKEWGTKLGIGTKNSFGKWYFTYSEASLLETVKALRDEGSGFHTITRKLGLADAAGTYPDTGPPGANSVTTAATTDQIVSAVTLAIKENNDLAEKYARATYEIGELRATVKHLEEQRQEDRRQLAEARDQIKLLEAPKEAPVPLPWWRRLWGQPEPG